MPSTAVLTRVESQARTRERLVNAAERVFLKSGFHAASIGQIAKAAGRTTGAVYSNFAGKEELALAVLERRVERVAEALQDRLASAAATVADRLDAVGGLWADMLGTEEWAVLTAEFALATRHNPATRARFLDGITRARRVLSAVLADQHLALDIDERETADRLASAVLALGVGLSVLRIADPQLDPATFPDALGRLLEAAE